MGSSHPNTRQELYCQALLIQMKYYASTIRLKEAAVLAPFTRMTVALEISKAISVEVH